jgi:peptidoglycan/xylan/chitin deacetylase (PgdA/CDA1 family)
MKRVLKKIILRIANYIPNYVYRILVPREMISFFYHLVAEKAVPHVQYLFPYRPVDAFEQDLIYLKKKFHVVSYEELASALASQNRLPPKAAFLSFDDGLSECFSMARPLLLKHNIPCTFFVTTDLMDNRRMEYHHQVSLCIAAMSSREPGELAHILFALRDSLEVNLDSLDDFIRWIKKVNHPEHVTKILDMLGIDVENYLRTQKPYLSSEQIRQMAAEGFTIGAHSQSHRKLGLLSQEEIEKEIINSCQVIRDLTNKEPVPFAFPFSGWGIERDYLDALLKRTPLVGLLFDTKGLSIDKPFIVNRIWVEEPWVSPDGRTPLPLILRRVYQKQLGLRSAV